VSEHREATVRPMEAADADVVAAMARELAAALDDPAPVLSPSDLLRDGMGPERWSTASWPSSLMRWRAAQWSAALMRRISANAVCG
jgi:hypothetical protein